MKHKILTALLIAAIVGVIAGKDKIIEISVERACTFILGAKLDIASMRVGVFRPVVEIYDMRLYNPPGFQDELMTSIPEIYVSYDVALMLKGRLRFRELVIDIKEFDVVKDAGGKVNIDALKPVKNSTPGEELEGSEKGKLPDIHIDKFRLKAGTLYFRDYGHGGAVRVRKFEVGLDESYEDITDPYTLIRLIIYRILHDTAISNIINLPMNGVMSVMRDAYSTGASAISTTMDTAKAATGTLTNAAKGLERMVAAPFNSPGEKKTQ
jgi:uncharacterized protein involved in outer membrane biogenesis